MVASCAPKRTYVARDVPDWDLVQRIGLEAPDELSASQRSSFERAWRSLQEGRLDEAAGELERLYQRYRGIAEVDTAAGFLELRLGNEEAAESRFQAALREEPAYGPAQSGQFLVALLGGDEEKALDRLTRLERSYPQHELVDRYGMTLRVNVAESRLRSARELASAGRYEEAASAYAVALEVAPEAGSLYQESAEAELEAGLLDRAVVHALRATELEPMNADAHRVLAEASYAKEDLASAVSALRAAVSLRPTDAELRSRLEQVEGELREKTLPAEYEEIPEAHRITREQLAALVYVELRPAFESASIDRSVIATDIAESWAAQYIRNVVGAGVLEVFPNHMFHPNAFVSRIELARALARALQVLAPEAYEKARESSSQRDFPDLPQENPSYGAASLSLSLGLLQPGEGGAFEPQRLATGSDALSAVGALGAYMTP